MASTNRVLPPTLVKASPYQATMLPRQIRVSRHLTSSNRRTSPWRRSGKAGAASEGPGAAPECTGTARTVVFSSEKARAKRLEELQGQIAKLQEEIESADDAESATPEKPKMRAGADLSEAITPAEIDPIVADLLKPTSTVYDKAGFKEYKFDATTKEVQAITPFKPVDWTSGLERKTRVSFCCGRLKGIRRAYATTMRRM